MLLFTEKFKYQKYLLIYMTTIEEHKLILKELFEDLNEKIRADLIEERQKIISFTASEASAHLFAIFLHKLTLISPGFNINHRFFSSIQRANEKFSFDFPDKEKILEFLVKQEQFRHKLCYGRNKDKSIVEEAISNLFELKKLIETIIGDKIC